MKSSINIHPNAQISCEHPDLGWKPVISGGIYLGVPVIVVEWAKVSDLTDDPW